MPSGVYEHKKGYHLSEEARNNIRKSHRGEPPSFKGRHHSKETKKKISEAQKSYIHRDRLLNINDEKLRELYIDKKWTQKQCGYYFGCSGGTIKRRLLRINIIIRNQKEARALLKLAGEDNPFYGKHHNEETRRIIKEKRKLQIITKESIRKTLTRRLPTSLEYKFQKIINKNNLPYKYVGDGKFFIERYNPDFINTNSRKIAIEVYAKYYKLRHDKTIEDWKNKRNKVFKNYGWNLIYFDETEVNEDCILKILGGV